jgi:CBS domain-containing protein
MRGEPDTADPGASRGAGLPSSAPSGALTDVVEFLRAHPPFDALPADEVARVARSAEIEFHREATTIFSQGAEPVHHVRMIRSGAVELIHDGGVLDLLGQGELFGQASMLSGLPAGFTARAHEDTLCYRIGEDVALPILARPETVGFVARSLLALPRPATTAGARGAQPVRDPAHQPVGTLLRGAPVVVGPDTPIRDAARSMSEAGETAVVVALRDGLGIVTDRDLRSRVVAAGVGGDAPVSSVMTAPAHVVTPDRLGGGVLLEMLDRGVRHFPVLSARGEVIGVIADLDLVAVETRNSFYVRRLVAGADTLAALCEATAQTGPMIVALHDSRLAATSIAAIYSVVLDVITRRLVELAIAELGEPEAPFALLALGSHARREAVPSSDLDSAIVWYGGSETAAVRPALRAIGARVVEGSSACGFRPDANGVNAGDERVVRSAESWRRVARSWMGNPTQEQALLLVSVFVDSRPVWGISAGPPIAGEFEHAPEHPALLRLLARFALSHRPPTGFLRGLVVEHSGERRGQLDLKHGGIIPIVDLARWAAMSAGVTSTSTEERLRAGRDAGTLPREHVQSLIDAYELIVGLRIEHQIEQLAGAADPDDYIAPAELSPLTRSYLKESFRAIAAAQKHVAAELQVALP